jgi:WD40 repeat protein
MTQGNHFSCLIFCAVYFVQVLTAVGAPTTLPTTQPGAAAVNAAEIRRFGDTKFSALSSDDGDSGDFSADGQRLLTAGIEGRVWDVNTGRLIVTLDAAGELCRRAVYCGSDKIVASYYTNRKLSIVVHDARTGARLSTIDSEETGPLLALAASRDGKRVVAVGKNISLLDPQTGKQLAILGKAQNPAYLISRLPSPRVQFTADSQMIMAITDEMKAHFFDADTGNEDQIEPFATRYGATISDDGRTIAVLNEKTELFDVATRKRIPLPEPVSKHHTAANPRVHSSISCARMGPGGLLAVGSSAPEPRVYLWDTAVRPIAAARSIPCRDVFPLAFAFSNDAHKLAVLSPGTRPEVIDLNSGTPICQPESHMGDITAMAVSADCRALVTGDSRGSTAVWNIATGKRVAFNDGAGVSGLAATPGNGIRFDLSGKTIFVASPQGTVGFFDAASMKLLKLINPPGPATQPATQPANQPTTQPSSTGVATSRSLSRRSEMMRNAICSVDCKQIAEWSPNLSVRLFSAESFRPTMEVDPHVLRATRLGISQDGKLLAVPVAKGLNLYEIPTGGLIVKRSDTLNTTILGQPIFSPDTRRVALVETAGIALWNSTAGTADEANHPLWEMSQLGDGVGNFDELGMVLAVADFLPNIGGARDMRKAGVTLYETDSGKPIVRLSGVPAVVEAVNFVPGRSQLITAGADGCATLWDLRALLLDPSVSDFSDAQLWEQMKDPDPAPAYRAAAELDRRGRLVALCTTLSADVLSVSDDKRFQRWIAELSSSDEKRKESAHKKLEHAGAAAIAEVSRAIAQHPGGETEARLNDILRLISINGDAAPRGNPAGVLQAKRAVRWLAWSPDKLAAAEYLRLTGESPGNAASRPSTSEFDVP